MFDPITASLGYVSSAIFSGMVGNRSDALLHKQWKQFKANLQNYRPDANHDLQAAVYRAYLLATLQTCAALLEQKGLRVAAWFKLGVLPEKMANALRGLLRDAPTGVIAQGDQDWLERVARDHLAKLKRLDDEPTELPSAAAQPELDALLHQLDLLMQPVEAQAREQQLRQAMTARLLADLGERFGPPPADFVRLIEARGFEFLCAAFQFTIKHNQAIANAFQSRLLARLVATRDEWQGALATMGGEALQRIEAAQAWLGEQQREGLARIESLLNEMLPLLAFARDEAVRGEMLAALIQAESQRVVDEVQASRDGIIDEVKASRDDIIAEIKRRPVAPPQFNAPQPLIHSLQIDKEIEGRINECRIILQAMGTSEARVLAFAAPGGFGKTALLTRLVQALAPDGVILERVTLPNGATVTPHVRALLHSDCRGGLAMSVLFQKAGRLIGQERAFIDLYNAADLPLADKLQRVFEQVSAGGPQRVWFVFDNFETLMAADGSVMDEALREFFKGIITGNHGVRALIVARDIPKIAYSERQQFLELRAIGHALYQGLPQAECVSYLRKNDAHIGLRGSDAEIEAVLTGFAARVHWMPMALEWAVGYLEDVRESGETLQTLLAQGERFFREFDQKQMDDGLKRLHYEQLRLQPAEAVGVLRLLAFFNRATPKGALVHLLDEKALNEVLASLVRRKLITRKETSDAYTLYLGDPLAVNLFSLHPIICENEFFKELDNPESLYETTANACWKKAYDANEINRFAYALVLYECAEALCWHLITEHKRADLWNSYAAMSMNKGFALNGLTRLAEATAEYDKAIAIRERLVNEEGQAHLANGLAMAYMNRGVALDSLSRLSEAIAEYDKAIAIRERLVNEEGQAHLANDLAMAYINKGVALRGLTRLAEAIAEYDKAIAINERLVNEEGQAHLANDLAAAYMNRGVALDSLIRPAEAIAEYDKAIAIRERLVNEEGQAHLANDLAKAYMNKGAALYGLTRLSETIAEYDKAIAIRERLVNEEGQAHLASGLSMAYANKALALERQQDWDAAFACYENALKIRAACVAQGMYWLMPSLLQLLNNRLNTRLRLRRWREAAADIEAVIGHLESFIKDARIHDELKQAAAQQQERMLGYLHNLKADEREKLYAELGERAEIVRQLVEASD